ncbi:MAG: YybS family protein [Desulfobacteraceae bacterium]|jgi:uncharacterized protein YybS (DUF2232 family)|nr:YybS family protein [Desulfobacteraceae bacterium]
MAKDIATGLGLTLIIFLIAAQVPIFGFFGAVFLPLPTLFYRIKAGRQTGAVIVAAATTLFMVLGGGLSPDVFFFIDLLVIGFVLGELFLQRLSIEQTTIATVAAALGVGILALAMAAGVSQEGLGSLVGGYVDRNLETTLALYQGMGMPEDNIRLITESLDRIQYVLVRLLPAMAATTILVVTWANLIMGRAILVRRGLNAPDFGPLNHWKAPEALVWVAIGAALLLLAPPLPLKLIGANALLVLMVIYFFQGIAIVSHFFHRKALPRPMRIFLYSLIAIQQILLLLVIILGFFDLWFNFRRLQPESRR